MSWGAKRAQSVFVEAQSILRLYETPNSNL
jgi:hypothetical protein